MEKEEKLEQEQKPENEEIKTENDKEEEKKEIKEINAKKSEQKNKENEKITLLEIEKNELYDNYLRLRADFENYKKRTEKDKSEAYVRVLEDIFSKLLPVLDNFERAIEIESDDAQAIIGGVKMVYTQFAELLKKEGLQMIEAENKLFDPQYHHAVMTECDESKEDNVITMILQNGYMLKERVIRPAMVKVNKL